MGLVDDYEADLPGFQFADEALVLEPLGREVEELDLSEFGFLHRQVGFAAGKAAMDVDCRNVVGAEVVDLVLHQGNQGGDNHRKARKHQAGHLESDALASAGGHQGEGVGAAEHGADDLGLQGAESLIPPVALQGVGRG